MYYLIIFLNFLLPSSFIPPQNSVYFLMLTFWRRNYFFLILAHPVYKMWVIQEPNK